MSLAAKLYLKCQGGVGIHKNTCTGVSEVKSQTRMKEPKEQIVTKFRNILNGKNVLPVKNLVKVTHIHSVEKLISQRSACSKQIS